MSSLGHELRRPTYTPVCDGLQSAVIISRLLQTFHSILEQHIGIVVPQHVGGRFFRSRTSSVRLRARRSAQVAVNERCTFSLRRSHVALSRLQINSSPFLCNVCMPIYD